MSDSPFKKLLIKSKSISSTNPKDSSKNRIDIHKNSMRYKTTWKIDLKLRGPMKRKGESFLNFLIKPRKGKNKIGFFYKIFLNLPTGPVESTLDSIGIISVTFAHLSVFKMIPTEPLVS